MGTQTGGQIPKEIGGFEILAKLGQGAMGAVFKARQTALDRVVALKILPPEIARDKDFIERFVREARASAKLNHPNVVAGIDVGRDEAAGLWYFAMEFVDGSNCRQLLQHQGRLSENRALKIVREIADALQCAHQNGMVHRDVKPDNILINADGEAKLADLGLARHQSDDAGLTQAGTALGTPYYMSPEQVRGEVDKLDTRSDLYALGATLFHLVTGQPPFRGETSAVIMARHLSDPPPMASRVCSEVSPGCSKLILKLMQKEKSQRYQTPREVMEQIDRLLSQPSDQRSLTTGPRAPLRGGTTSAPRDTVRPRLEQKPERTPARGNRAVLFGAIGGIVLLAIAGAIVLQNRQTAEPGSGEPVASVKSPPLPQPLPRKEETKPQPVPPPPPTPVKPQPVKKALPVETSDTTPVKASETVAADWVLLNDPGLFSAPKVSFENGIAEMDSTSVSFPRVNGHDLTIRAMVRKMSGQNLMFRLRQSSDGCYVAWFNGGNSFGIGIVLGGKYQDLKAGASKKSYDGFFDCEFSAVGNRLILKVEGDVVVEVQNDRLKSGTVGVGAFKGRSCFRDIRAKGQP